MITTYCEPELIGDDIEEAEIEYYKQPLEVRADKIRERGLAIVREWDNEDGENG